MARFVIIVELPQQAVRMSKLLATVGETWPGTGVRTIDGDLAERLDLVAGDSVIEIGPLA